jgi:hypothetical protein
LRSRICAHAGFFGFTELRHLRVSQHGGEQLFRLPLHLGTTLHALTLSSTLPATLPRRRALTLTLTLSLTTALSSTLATALPHGRHCRHLQLIDLGHRLTERRFLFRGDLQRRQQLLNACFRVHAHAPAPSKTRATALAAAGLCLQGAGGKSEDKRCHQCEQCGLHGVAPVLDMRC